MWSEIEPLAALIFTSSALLLAIALVLISSCWRTLKEVLLALPPTQRKIIFNLRQITDKRRKYKEELKGSLWLAILFLGLMIGANFISMGCSVRTMLGMHGGVLGETSVVYELQDFVVAKWALVASVLFLFVSLFSLLYYKLPELFELKRGKLEIIKELSRRETAISGQRKRARTRE